MQRASEIRNSMANIGEELEKQSQEVEKALATPTEPSPSIGFNMANFLNPQSFQKAADEVLETVETEIDECIEKVSENICETIETVEESIVDTVEKVAKELKEATNKTSKDIIDINAKEEVKKALVGRIMPKKSNILDKLRQKRGV